MNNVFASVQTEKEVADGAGSQDYKFNVIWVGVAGAVAISRDNGNSFVIYTPENAGFLNVAGTYLGTAADGTAATGIKLGRWGPL